MRKVLLGLLLLAVVAGGALGISGVPTSQNGSITVSSTAVGFPATACRVGGVATGAPQAALIQIATADIYFRLNSSTATPTATDFTGSAGDVLEIARPHLFRAIRATGTDGYVNYQCFER